MRGAGEGWTTGPYQHLTEAGYGARDGGGRAATAPSPVDDIQAWASGGPGCLTD